MRVNNHDMDCLGLLGSMVIGSSVLISPTYKLGITLGYNPLIQTFLRDDPEAIVRNSELYHV